SPLNVFRERAHHLPPLSSRRDCEPETGRMPVGAGCSTGGHCTRTGRRRPCPRTPRTARTRRSRSEEYCTASRSLSFLPKLGFPPGQQLPERVGVQFRDPLSYGLDRTSRDAAHVGQLRRLTGSALLLPVVHLLHQLAVAQELDALLFVRQQVRRC